MATPNYRPSRDEEILEALWITIEGIDEEIVKLERTRKKLMDQIYFLQDDVTRKGVMDV